MDAKIIKHLSQDAKLASFVHKIELETFIPDLNLFNALIRSIVYQQLSGKAAGTIYRRFLDTFGEGHPSPRDLANKSIEDLRGVGFSRQKANYAHNVAEFFLNNPRKDEEWLRLDDDTILKELTQIKGVGEWTVQMILMFYLDREDVFPVKDLGIQHAMQALYGLEELKGRELSKEMIKISEKWSPYRTYACRFLWKWTDNAW